MWSISIKSNGMSLPPYVESADLEDRGLVVVQCIGPSLGAKKSGHLGDDGPT